MSSAIFHFIGLLLLGIALVGFPFVVKFYEKAAEDSADARAVGGMAIGALAVLVIIRFFFIG